MKTVYFRPQPPFSHIHKQKIIDAIEDEISNAPADAYKATFDQVRKKLKLNESQLPDGVLEQIFSDMDLVVKDG